jgi:L-galactose dehydrogenase/L-glyceraldehyde 3-phosphate reductase
VTSGDMMSTDLVLDEVLPALERLKREGKTRWIGITALGETEALHKVVATGAFDTAQICFNALNPSADADVPSGFPGQDYRRLMTAAAAKGMGTIGIRVLAGGALSGSEARHPLNMQVVEPIGSGRDFKEDVERAQRFLPLIRSGVAADLPEFATRFAVTSPSLSTALIGLANLEQLEAAYRAVMKGPLSPEELAQLGATQAGFVA